jgi:alkylation response protein AidB-like acyl-CoA dehydrogenase
MLTLTTEQRDLAGAVRAFADERVRPVIHEYERDERVPLELVEEMTALGFLGATVPAEWGGAGLDLNTYLVLLAELERAAGSLRTMVSVHNSLVAQTILSLGTAEQQERLLPRLGSGEAIGAFCLTEPDAGSNPAQMRASARLLADGCWLLRGEKTFITNANLASIFLVFAREHGGRISAFVVERGADGLATSPLKGKLGLRASDTGSVHLDDVVVGPENLVGERGHGLRVALHALDNGRLGVAAAAASSARHALELSLAYTTQREQFGRPVAARQLVQSTLADMHVDAEAASALVDRAAAAKASGRASSIESTVAKLYASEAANRNAYRAVQLHGGYGFFEEYEVARLYRDARVLTLYEGTSEVQRLLIGKHLTGINAFS